MVKIDQISQITINYGELCKMLVNYDYLTTCRPRYSVVEFRNMEGRLIYINCTQTHKIFTNMGQNDNPEWSKYLYKNKLLFRMLSTHDDLKEAYARCYALRESERPLFIPHGIKRNAACLRPVRCMSTGRTYDSITDCALAEGVHRVTLQHHLGGRPGYNTVKGRRFEYVTSTVPLFGIFEPTRFENPNASTELLIHEDSIVVDFTKKFWVYRHIISNITAIYAMDEYRNVMNANACHVNDEWRKTSFSDFRTMDVQIVGQYETYNEAKNVLKMMIALDKPRFVIEDNKVKFPKFVCVTTGEKYVNQAEIVKAMGLDASTLAKHLRNMPGYNDVNGYVFERI